MALSIDNFPHSNSKRVLGFPESSTGGLKSLLTPDSIAIIGASQDFSTINGKILKYLLKHGYQGNIYPVNPKYDSIANLKCYASVKEIPGDVDLVLIAVAAVRVLDILQQCVEIGVKSAVIFSSGFAETGDSGRQIQEQILELAGKNGMRICGPNCLGMLNVPRKVTAGFSSSLEVDHILQGPVGLVSQSGAVGFMLFNLLQESHIGISQVVTTGNEVDLSALEVLNYLIEDPDTGLIVTYMEGIKQGQDFAAVADRALDREKPIIALKVGTSATGQKAASTHTAALTGSDATFRAFFKQKGIIRVKDSDELIDIAKIFTLTKRPKGNRVAIITLSGGVGIMMADRCEEENLEVLELRGKTREEIEKIIPAFGSAQNPVDVTAQTLNSGGEFKKCLQILVEDESIDVLTIALTMATGELAARIAQDIVEVAEVSPKPIAVSWSVGEIAAPGFRVLEAGGVPLYHSPARCIRALGALVRYSKFVADRKSVRQLRQVVAVSENLPDNPCDSLERQVKAGELLRQAGKSLSEHQAKEVLALYDLPVTQEKVATIVEEAVNIANQIGYPVVMKIESPDILHKTDAKALKLNLQNKEQVAQAFVEIVTNARKYKPDAVIKGVLVQEMVPEGVEVIIGVNNDPQFGPTIMFGLGGIFVEVLKDVSLRVAPISREDAEEMIKEIKGSKLLSGVRGKPAADVEAIIDVLLKISKLVTDHGDIKELDINPLIVLPKGQGARVADAVIVK